jgi:predicted HTH domain antitoxin
MTVVVDLPESALKALHAETESAAVAELRLAAAVKLFEIGRLSSGAAADLAGLHRIEFLERLKEFGVSPFQHTPEDLQRDIDTLRALGG